MEQLKEVRLQENLGKLICNFDAKVLFWAIWKHGQRSK